MRKMLLILLGSLLLSGCGSVMPQSLMPGTVVHTEIDWVDFVHIQDKQYAATYAEVIADPEFIGKQIGEVEFNVAGNVTNSGYRTKDGDAAFWAEGTPIFEVEGVEEFIAVPDPNEVNGYRLYRSDAASETHPVHYKDMDFEGVQKVGLYKGYTDPELVNVLEETGEIERLLELLDTGTPDSTFSSTGDEQMVTLVFYKDAPLAYKLQLFFNGASWFWYPWDLEVISEEIGELVGE